MAPRSGGDCEETSLRRSWPSGGPHPCRGAAGQARPTGRTGARLFGAEVAVDGPAGHRRVPWPCPKPAVLAAQS